MILLKKIYICKIYFDKFVPKILLETSISVKHFLRLNVPLLSIYHSVVPILSSFIYTVISIILHDLHPHTHYYHNFQYENHCL